MPFLGPVGFGAPWLLWGLALLPVLWILLRAVPPAPIRRRFPGIALLLGLRDSESQSDRTPWWLLLLRMAVVAAVIVGFAGPVLNPKAGRAGDGPLLVLVDATWADARDWPARMSRVSELLAEAGRVGRPVAVMALTAPGTGPPVFQSADVWAGRLAGISPRPWAPSEAALADWTATLGDAAFETFWISDGLDRDSRAPLLAALEARGPVIIFESGRPVYGLRPVRFEDGLVQLSLSRVGGLDAREVGIAAFGTDPAGQERALSRDVAMFESGAQETTITLNLLPEIRNRISRFAIEGERSAGAVTLADDGLRRREVALIAGRDGREGLELLSPLYYLNKALEQSADLIDGTLNDILLANPDVIVLADVATLTESETRDVADWVVRGGLLLRFAG
ncbi:MAG: BatA domain-containing protein, partial [Paracoccaceae bacterium]